MSDWVNAATFVFDSAALFDSGIPPLFITLKPCHSVGLMLPRWLQRLGMCKRAVITASSAPREAPGLEKKKGQKESKTSPYCYHLSTKPNTSLDAQDAQGVIFETSLKRRDRVFSERCLQKPPCGAKRGGLWAKAIFRRMYLPNDWRLVVIVFYIHVCITTGQRRQCCGIAAWKAGSNGFDSRKTPSAEAIWPPPRLLYPSTTQTRNPCWNISRPVLWCKKNTSG